MTGAAVFGLVVAVASIDLVALFPYENCLKLVTDPVPMLLSRSRRALRGILPSGNTPALRSHRKITPSHSSELGAANIPEVK